MSAATAPIARQVREAFAGVVGEAAVISDPAELSTYDFDASLDTGRADAVVLPNSADDVARLARWAASKNIPLIARGAGTGLSGGSVPEHGGVIVGFSRMARIIEIDDDGRSVVVEPGVTNFALDTAVRARGLYFPPDPSSGRAATLGGNVAENAGGPHCFKYGVTSNYVTGLEVVLAGGARMRLGGRALDYPELDLTGLVTGSEGTLALVTRIYAALRRNPPAVKTLMAAFASVEEAGEAVSAVIAAGLVPATLEMMDRKMMRIIEDFARPGLPVDAGAALIVETDGHAESVSPQMDEVAALLAAHKAFDLRIARSADERDRLWYGRKSAAGAMARMAPAYLLLDGTVPRSALARTLAGVNAICDELELRVSYVFHAGDGNLHPFILIPRPQDKDLVRLVFEAGRRVMALCVEMGGSITGEHGIGIEKRSYMPLMFNEDELESMRQVRAVFDPHQRLNPGKIFPPRAGATPRVAPAPVGAVAELAPATTEEAAEFVRAIAAEARATLRLRGGGTKSPPLPPTTHTLSTRGLTGIRALATADLYVTAGAGTTLDALQAELAPRGMHVPLVSPWPAATLGGILAANFNAPLRMRYGGTRDLLLAATVVLPDGRVIRAGRPVVKNVAGYDMPKLFVGSFGSVGLMTDVTLKLVPLPRAQATLVATLETPERALALARQLARASLVASAVLVTLGIGAAPNAVIVTAEGVREDVEAEMAQARRLIAAGGAVAESGPTGSEQWAEWLRATPPEATLVRAGVAAKDLPGLMSAADSAWRDGSAIADVANGLLYARTDAVDALQSAAAARQGYALVLRGPGVAGRWGYKPDGLEIMRGIKAAFDPRGAFNPGASVFG